MGVRSRFRLSLFLACGLLSAAHASLAYDTRRVVIVMIDGPRLSETLEEPGHPHVPGLWNRLIPTGAYLTEFHNEGLTKTNPGHAAVLTGTWQLIANNGSERPDRPTLFEYYRSHTGAPASDAWLVAGKWKLGALSYSTSPSYGAPFGASTNVVDRPDLRTHAAFKDVLSRLHPTLSLVSYSQVDIEGHTLDWPGYLGAITRVDSLVTDLWTWLESDSVYAGKTSLFLTYDHGRHLDSAGGFQNHGDLCAGCERLGFVALGPDIEAGFVSESLRRPIDIAPTVGELLGFPTPEAAGAVLREILRVPPPARTPPPAREGSEGRPSGPVLSNLRVTSSPGDPAVRISFEMEREAEVSVTVWSVPGYRVRTLEDGRQSAGKHEYLWDGTGMGGRPVAPATYIVRVVGSRDALGAEVVLAR